MLLVRYLDGLSILCVIPGRENRFAALLNLSNSPLVCGTDTVWFVDAQHLLEALLEVLREEAVEEGVGTGVDVGEDDEGEVDGVVGLGDDVDQVDDVGSEEGQPAKHKHQHDDHHHARYLSLRLSPLRHACTHAC